MSRTRIAAATLFAAFLTLTTACPGPAGPPCTVTDNGAGKKTISCPDGTSAVVNDGSGGGSCTVVDNGNGTKTITCANGTSVTVSNGGSGPAGDAGASCTVVDNGNGTKTIRCTDGTSATIANGDAGPAGSSCTVASNSDGSKTITCTDGTSVTVTPPAGSRLDPRDDLPGLVATITGVTGASNTDATFASGDHLAVTFTVTNTAGAPVNLADLDLVGIWVAGPTTNYQHLIPAARDQALLTDVKTAAVHNANGSWTYTFATGLPATYGVPLWDTTRFTDGELTGALQAGTYTVAMLLTKDYAVGSNTYPDVGSATRNFLFNHATTATAREVVTTANCNTCHERLEAHGGHVRDTKLCVTCHTSGAEDENSFVGTVDGGVDLTPVTIDFRVLIHKLHDGMHLPSVQGITVNDAGVRIYGTGVPYKVGGDPVAGPTDFSAVVFPAHPNWQNAMPRNFGYSALSSTNKTKDDNLRKGVSGCLICHGDPDGTGPLAAPAQGENYRLAPTRRACSSCHDDVNYTQNFVLNGNTMPAQANDTQCFTCHGDAGVTGGPPLTIPAHLHPMADPSFTIERAFHTTAFTNGADGGTRVGLNDIPRVTFTFKDSAGADVPITALDAMSMFPLGPTTNRQVPFVYGYSGGSSLAACGSGCAADSSSTTTVKVPVPYSTTSIQNSPFDFVGRLYTPNNSTGTSTTTLNKGIMSKVIPTAASTSEALSVLFTNATDFTVTGASTGALGSGSVATSSYPSGASVANIIVSPTVAAGAVTVTFSSSTAFTVAQGATTLGTGTLPAATAATIRFVSATLSFNITVGSVAFANGNVINMTVFKGAAANPVAFAVTGGNLAYANWDRFNYDYAAPSASYTTTIPMDVPLELIGVGTALTPAANLPLWPGHQSVFEVTGVTTGATAAAANTLLATPALARYCDVVTLPATLLINDVVMIDSGTNREYLVVNGRQTSPANRVWFKTPMRFKHAAGTAITKMNVAFRAEGLDYTIVPATGVVTLTTPNANDFILNYRTDGRFGWRRFSGDTVQALYFPPMNSDNKIGTNGLGVYDESWGDYGGKAYLSGTYTLTFFANSNNDFVQQNELQVYRGTVKSERVDFLYGAATTLTPYSLISSGDNCNACHIDLSFHGGGRRGGDVCVTCHGVAGLENNTVESGVQAGAVGSGGLDGTANMRSFLHQLHAETFPARPSGKIVCAKCHGTSTVWQQPTDRTYPGGTPVRNWQAPCSGCHNAADARGHMNAMTSSSGDESCPVCHEVGAEFDSTVMMKVR